MANALKDILGFAGKAADVVFLGGAVGKANRRNQFADYLGAGQYDEAEQLALRNGEGAYAQVAQQRAASASAQAAAEQKRQQEQFKYIQNSAAFLDSLTPDLQKAYLDLNGPALVEQGILDEEDLPILYQNVGVPAGFTGLARSAIDPNQQQQNIFEGQTIQETARSNRATEGLRGAEINISRGNLDISRQRLALEQEKAAREAALTAQGGQTQFKFGAEAMARAATGLPGIKAANQQLDELFSSGVRFNNAPGRGPVEAARNVAASTIDALPFGLGNFAEKALGTDERDLLVRAASSYESVLLPILSGAAVTPSEAKRQLKAAIPQPGDSDAVLKAKADHRKVTEQIIEAGVSGRPVNLEALYESTRTIEELVAAEKSATRSGVTLPSGQVLQEGQKVRQNGAVFEVRDGQLVPAQ